MVQPPQNFPLQPNFRVSKGILTHREVKSVITNGIKYSFKKIYDHI